MELSNIRNFVIISHIDHGKSTLADRFLEITGAVSKDKMKAQFLDSMDLEREKGITIKMHPVRLIWRSPNQSNGASPYILNLIDTPGHIDFCYEISRALACCEGALLLVDAVKGIQAQTLYNLQQAQNQGLTIIGVVNKIDLPQARVQETKKELADILNQSENDIFAISGKTGENVEQLLSALVEKTSPPCVSDSENGLKALVFDSKYDSFSGVVAYVRVFEGEIQPGDKIRLMQANYLAEVKEVGYFMPHLRAAPCLKSGEIGYIKTGIKIPAKVRVGETIVSGIGYNDKAPFPGYKEPQLVLFLSVYPSDSDDFERLKDSLEKLALNDPALDFTAESKMVLGRGFRVGFLGALHAEITVRRLKQEFNLDLIATSPQVIFKIRDKKGKETFISSPSAWPDPSLISEVQEPWATVEIITPNSYVNGLFPLLKNFNINVQETKFLTNQKSILLCQTPLREIVSGAFYDKLKASTEGYGSFSFKIVGYQKNDLVKVDILIAGKPEEAFAKILPKDTAFEQSKGFLSKLKDTLPSQQFAVSLQAAIGGKIIAREDVSSKRKDVTAPLYGGDVTRKRKLLDKQKKGKKELQKKGQMSVPPSVFLEMLKD